MFHVRVPYDVHVLDLKMGFGPEKSSMPDSQIVQYVLDETQQKFRDVRKNAMRAYFKYKAYYDRKAKASKLKERNYIYLLEPKAAHQGSKILFIDFRKIWPFIVEEALLDDNYLVREIGTDEMLVFYRMRLRLFTPRETIPDVQTTAQKKKPILKLLLNLLICMPEHGSLTLESLFWQGSSCSQHTYPMRSDKRI